ncbi:hypothetical protein GCM10010197_13850 [Nocardioides luteus]|uniref:Secreted protein n=1 Tax=Nocardioides luteus TaxID=1844 RepID=A0ABQ5SVS9_9ACTN|nr:hypothetical protein GCM10010197_13850 [Nocardioides luteus]GLJ67592.1 hypothetical protein GCM10017579_16280 [Nocardioides luteus]
MIEPSSALSRSLPHALSDIPPRASAHTAMRVFFTVVLQWSTAAAQCDRRHDAISVSANMGPVKQNRKIGMKRQQVVRNSA